MLAEDDTWTAISTGRQGRCFTSGVDRISTQQVLRHRHALRSACRRYRHRIASLLLLGIGKSGGSLPVEARPILTNRERKALIALEAALPQHRIFPQVAMGALIKVKGGLPAKKRASVHNSFAQKVVDFVAEDRQSGELLLIEVDDRTHDAAKDRRRDAITEAAGYRTVRVPAGTRPDLNAIRSLVGSAGCEVREEGRLSIGSTCRQDKMPF